MVQSQAYEMQIQTFCYLLPYVMNQVPYILGMQGEFSSCMPSSCNLALLLPDYGNSPLHTYDFLQTTLPLSYFSLIFIN